MVTTGFGAATPMCGYAGRQGGVSKVKHVDAVRPIRGSLHHSVLALQPNYWRDAGQRCSRLNPLVMDKRGRVWPKEGQRRMERADSILERS